MSLSWIGVKGLSLGTALEELGFELDAKGARAHLPRRFGAAELPNGWLLIMSRGLRVAFEDRFVALSRHGPAVACALEEHVMYSEARGYEAGAETWRVVHDPDNDEGVQFTGRPPAEFERIRLAAMALQKTADEENDDGGDYTFEVPADLAKSLCGFKVGDTDPYDPEFAEIRKGGRARGSGSGHPGLLQRLFGRR